MHDHCRATRILGGRVRAIDHEFAFSGKTSKVGDDNGKLGEYIAIEQQERRADN